MYIFTYEYELFDYMYSHSHCSALDVVEKNLLSLALCKYVSIFPYSQRNKTAILVYTFVHIEQYSTAVYWFAVPAPDINLLCP